METSVLLKHIATVLERHVRAGNRLVVGLSGGLDSVVLLILLRRLQDGFELAAHHVNHQISPNAESWAEFAANLCADIGVPFGKSVIDAPRNSGKGLEAAARMSRYAVFRDLDADFILLGHHQDDQAETLLLRLLRGSGVKGMGAMAECTPIITSRGRGIESVPHILRPLLHVPRSALLTFARAEGLHWIDDESNADPHYTRNYLRAELLPSIEKRFPAYRTILDRAATHFAEADRLLDELADDDARDAIEQGRMSIRALSSVSEPHAKNLLRYFLGRHDLKMPDHDRLFEILRQVTNARSDAAVCVNHDGVELRLFSGWLYVVRPLSIPGPDFELRWDGQLQWTIPALRGTMVFQETQGGGIAKKALLQSKVSVRVRRGGEKLRVAENRPRQTLRNLLHAAAIPPWERERLPLLYIDDKLAYVPGVGVDAMFQAQPGAEGMVVEWVSVNCGI